MKFLLTILIVCTILPCVYSQDSVTLGPDPKISLTHIDSVPSNIPEKIKEIRAVQIVNRLNIDGILNEPEWALAPPSPHFVQIEPEQGKPVHFETKIKV